MPNPQKSPVHDLRSALELLKTLPGELVSTDVEVDPIAELSGVPPVLLGEGQQPQCQEVVHLASDPDFDLRTLLAEPGFCNPTSNS